MLGVQDINICDSRIQANRVGASNHDTKVSARFTYLILVLMGLVNFDQALSARLGPFEHELYVLTAFTVFLYSISKINIYIFILTVAWCVAGLIFSSPEKIFWRWVISDYFIISLPLIFSISFRKINTNIINTALPWIITWLIVCAIVSKLFEYDDFGRTEPPDLILIAAVSYYMSVKKGTILWAASLLYVVLAYLTFESQVRTYLVFIVFLPFVISLFLNQTRLVFFIYIGILLIVLLELFNIGFQHQRFQEIDLTDLTANHFFQGRASEVYDLSKEFKNLKNYIFGLGPGAVFIGDELLSTTVWIYEQDFRMTSDGYVHLVHFGPAAFYFRFGVLGLIIFFIMWPGVAVMLFMRARSKKFKDLCIILSVALILLWLNSFVRPSYVNIDFAVIFGMCIMLVLGKKYDKS